jgi:hypothetical protein
MEALAGVALRNGNGRNLSLLGTRPGCFVGLHSSSVEIAPSDLLWAWTCICVSLGRQVLRWPDPPLKEYYYFRSNKHLKYKRKTHFFQGILTEFS